MQQIILLSLVLACATASAQVFRHVGPDGRVYFTDRPGVGAEQVELSPVQTISLPAVPARTTTTVKQVDDGNAKQQVDVTSYSAFSIVSPTNGQGVRANNGNVTIQLSLKPALRSGHTIAIDIDGEDGQKVKTGNSMAIEIKNMSRGLHTIEATVIDDTGKVLTHAGPVSFYVLRVALGGRR